MYRILRHGPITAKVREIANRFGARPAYEVILASPGGGDILCNPGVRLAGSVALADLPDDLDTILVSGGDEAACARRGNTGNGSGARLCPENFAAEVGV